MRARSDATCRSAARSAACSSATRSSAEPQRGDRAVVLLVEADLALVELADPALHGLELGLGLLRAGGGLLDGVGQPRHPVVDRLDPGAHGVDLTGQARQALAPVGLGPHRRHVGAFGLGRRAFACSASSARAASRRELGPRRARRAAAVSRAATSSASASSASGSGPGARGGLGVEVLRAFAGDAHGRADPFGQRRQPEPGLLGGLGALGQRRRPRPRGPASASVAICQPGSGLVVLAAQRGLGVVGPVELGPAHDQVVGGQPQPRVAQVGLDGLRPAGHLGLPAQRLELAAQLGGQVGEPGQVGRHRRRACGPPFPCACGA